MPSIQPVRFGKYVLLDKIAVGGMAELYRAKIYGAQGFQKLVAVKKILPHLSGEKELVESFIDEARLAALLQHENIAAIYDFGRMESDYFIAMEFLFGKNLRMVMEAAREKEKPLAMAHVLHIAARVCEGLDYAHQLTDLSGEALNIIHRDISPPNVFLTYEGQVKIVDFGVAKAASRNTTTQSGIIKGKVAYMSPEQARGEAMDHRADIFAVGALLYEMATGRRLYSGDQMEVLNKARKADFVPPDKAGPDVPPALAAILAKALTADPEKRYQTCGEMLQDLENLMEDQSLRPTARSLAHYLVGLFADEIPVEEKTMRMAAGSDPKLAPGDIPPEPRTLYEDEEFIDAYRKKVRIKKIIAAGAAAVVLVTALILLIPSSPKSPVPREALAAIEEKRYADAITLFEEAVQENPEVLPKVAYHYARCLVEQASQIRATDPDASRELLKKAVELEPKNVQARFRLGLAFLKKKEYPEAVTQFERVLEQNPNMARAYFNLGYIFAVTGKTGKAEAMYERTVALSPPFLDEALANLAAVQDNLGKTRDAVGNMEKAVAINPGNQQAVEYLQWLRQKQDAGP